MYHDQYRLTVHVMLIMALIMGLIALFHLVAAISRWRTENRGWRLRRFAAFSTLTIVAIALPALLGRILIANGWLHRRDTESAEILRPLQEALAARASESAIVGKGDLAPPFEVETTDGAVVSLDELRGKVVLLNFFATDCGPCLRELPHLDGLWRSRAHREELAVLVVGREESTASVAAFRKKHGLALTMAADPDRSVYAKYAKELIPRTYLIARDGTIAWSAAGFVEEEAKIVAEQLDRELDRPGSFPGVRAAAASMNESQH